jgi:lysophospholipase L1-like esterase
VAGVIEIGGIARILIAALVLARLVGVCCRRPSFLQCRLSASSAADWPNLLGTRISGYSPHSVPTRFDGVHPNEKGYAIMEPLVLAVIDKTLGT